MTERVPEPKSQTTQVLILGGTGYVSGELLRLLASHPRLRVRAVLSTRQAEVPVEEAFPHLRGAFPELHFGALETLPTLLAQLQADADGQPLAVFAAGPHGASAGMIDRVLAEAESRMLPIHLVDLSADFRFPDAEQYREIYGVPHGAPHRLSAFWSGLPEHGAWSRAAGGGEPSPSHTFQHVAHPGCFTTAVTLASVPLLKLDLIEPWLNVSAVTGSTGSGRTPTSGTHHPERNDNFYGYKALSHRHEPEMRRLIGQSTGQQCDVAFIPHSGPFSRGIHATVQARLKEPLDAKEVSTRLAEFYRHAPFVSVQQEPPRLRDVVTTNRCGLAVATRGHSLVVFSVIDNLVKGAAGGGIQWMNRLLGLNETLGLQQPGVGWA